MQDLPVNTDISNHTIVDYPIKDKREINENMFSTLELDEEYSSVAVLGKEWLNHYTSLLDEEPDLTWQEFVDRDFYGEGTYILDTESGVIMYADEFFRMKCL